MTRCKVGDLAIVARITDGADRWGHLVGKFVTLTDFYISPKGKPSFGYEGERLESLDGRYVLVGFHDEELIPIRHPGDEEIDEMLRIRPSPVWELAHKVTT